MVIQSRSIHKSLDQITNRSWSGALTVRGHAGSRSNTAVLGSAAGVEAVDVNVQSAELSKICYNVRCYVQ